MKNFVKKYALAFAIIVTAVLALVLRLIMVGDIPRGWNVDEAGIAYDAWCIAKYGVDRFRYPYPVMFMNYGGGGQSSLYTYMTAILFKFFDFSHFVARIPAVIMSMMVMFSGIWFFKTTGADKKKMVIWALLYAITPYFIMSARFGFDCNLMLGTASVFISCLAYALKKEKPVYFLIAGIACGLVLYTYTLSYIVMILFLIMMFIYLLYMRKLSFKQALCFCVPLALMAAPLIAVQLINILGLETRTIWKFTLVRLDGYRIKEIGLPKLRNIVNMLKVIFLHDYLGFNTNERYMTLYVISIPFFAVGFIKGIIDFIKSIKKRKFSAEAGVLLWFIAEFIMGMMLNEAITSRMNGIFFSVLYYIVIGIAFVIDVVKKVQLRAVISTVIAVAYLVFSISFIRYYFTTEKYNRYVGMEDDYKEAIEFIESQEYLNDKPIYVAEAYIMYIFYLVSLDTPPSPYDIDLSSNTETKQIGRYIFGLPEEENLTYHACYIIARSAGGAYPLLYPFGLRIKEFDNEVCVFYPDN